MATSSEPEKKGTFPKAVPYIIGNEAAERFSYYGYRSILATFLVAQFFNPANNPALQGKAEAQANEQVHFYVALAYFLPLIGGLIADWFFGKYKVILYVSIVYCFGHLFLSVFETDFTLFSVGLVLIAIGAGGIKSSVSANVGDQFNKSNEHLMSKVYGWFYFSINAGSVIATALIPWLYANYGASVAFGVPGILMAIATVVFWSGRKKYVRVPPIGLKKALQDVEMWKENFKAMGRVLAVFAFVPIFWALWDQNLSEWVLQAQKLDRTIWPGFTVLPEQVQTVNPFFILVMIPVFTYAIYPFFEKLGIKTTPLRRLGAGFVLTAISFVVIAWIQMQVDAGGTPSVWWQILAYFILTCGEVMVSITGLEYAYTHAPKAMKSLMSGIWLLTVSAGNLFVSFVNGSIASGGFFSQLKGADYFWFFSGLMFANALVFAVVSMFLKERKYVGEEETLTPVPADTKGY